MYQKQSAVLLKESTTSFKIHHCIGCRVEADRLTAMRRDYGAAPKGQPMSKVDERRLREGSEASGRGQAEAFAILQSSSGYEDWEDEWSVTESSLGNAGLKCLPLYCKLIVAIRTLLSIAWSDEILQRPAGRQGTDLLQKPSDIRQVALPMPWSTAFWSS